MLKTYIYAYVQPLYIYLLLVNACLYVVTFQFTTCTNLTRGCFLVEITYHQKYFVQYNTYHVRDIKWPTSKCICLQNKSLTYLLTEYPQEENLTSNLLHTNMLVIHHNMHVKNGNESRQLRHHTELAPLGQNEHPSWKMLICQEMLLKEPRSGRPPPALRALESTTGSSLIDSIPDKHWQQWRSGQGNMLS